MRRLWILLLGVGIVSTSLGCLKTMQYTAGKCDCNPPPVETLLVQPCPLYHPIVNPYSHYVPAPTTPVQGGAIAPVRMPVERVPIMPKQAETGM